MTQSIAQYSALNRILAVLGFDLAVENMLRLVVSTLNTAVRIDTETTFPKLVQQANDELQKAGLGSVPDEGRIKAVHHIRNDAQHNDRYPSEIEVSDCRTYTRDFLYKIVDQIWGQSFESVTLIDRLRNETARRFLSIAETALDQDHYQEAVFNANAGLSWALRNVPRILLGDSFRSSFRRLEFERNIHQNTFGSLREVSRQNAELWNVAVEMRNETRREFDKVYRVFGSLYDEIDQDFEAVRDTLVYFTLGMNHTDLLRVRGIAGNVYFSRDNEKNLQFKVAGAKNNVDKSDAEFVLAYCVEAVLQIETRIGNIEEPFT